MTPTTVHIRRALFALFSLVVAVQIVRLLGGEKDLAQGPLLVVEVGAASLCTWRAVVSDKDRLAWSLISIYLVLWMIGDLAWALEDLPSVAPVNWTDALYLSSYVFSAVGLLLLLRSRRQKARAFEWLDGLIGGLAFSALGAALLYGPLLEGSDAGLFSSIVTSAYPVLDLSILCFVVVAIGSAGWRVDRMWACLAAGLMLNAVADGLYTYSDFQGYTEAVSWSEILWPVAMLLTAAAAWQPRVSRPLHQDGMTSIAVPAAAAAVALGLLIGGASASGAMPVVVLVLASGALLVAGVRSVLTFRQNVSLLHDSRAEAMTDNLTGLGNRRALMEALDQQLADGSDSLDTTLVFFDLDGFKGYNDAFGHSAGDALLARLGRKLRSRVEGGGIAFRPGGDEFCVIFYGHHSRGDLLIADAAGALSEQGDGFDITASFGVVHLPLEADTPTIAMNVVDERMYDDKGDRRRSARSQARDLLLQLLHEREPELEHHVGEVATHTIATGRRMGIDGEELDELARGAELHDLGKVSIPDSILHKPGPLDDNEWRLMHQHTIVGERILSAVPSLQPVAKLVRSSHERWDGGGYPDGLAGEDIPLGARIIAACDAFDAMVSSRPYASAVSLEVAIEELERCSGTQFDPEVVAACVAVVRSGELDAQRESDIINRR